MKHIFLTGNIQCGKSTLIQSILSRSAGKITAAGGFLSYFTSRERNQPHMLYLGNASIYGTLFCKSNHAAYISPAQLHETLMNQNDSPVIAAKFCCTPPPQVNLDAFNIHGRIWIEQGLANAQAFSHHSDILPVLIFDECGYLESNAPDFQQTIYNALDGSTPILGVIRHTTTVSWLDSIRNHPNVQLVTVTESNRDALVPQLTRQLLSHV